jgi:acyl-CoA synthetase (AMP-forming)/AMP-acid ligase II/thioesterase domain-containing protein/acyl carrier protein
VHRSLDEVLGGSAPRSGSAPALLAPGRTPLTARGLADHVTTVVDALTDRGVARADRVAIVLPNGPEMASTFLGVVAAAVAAPVNPSYTAEELEFYLDDLGAVAVIVDHADDGPARDAARARKVPVLELHRVPDGAAGICTLDGPPVRAARDATVPGPDDLALVLHTSGTTSRPKLVGLTHANLGASARNIATALQLTADDRSLNMMPLFHIHGIACALLASLRVGASVVCTPGFDAARAAEWIEEFEPTWYSAVPTIHRALLDAIGDRSLRAPRLRFIRASSAPLPARTLEDLERAFAVPVIEAYGMTEASHQIATNPLPPGPRRPGTVGRATGCELAVVGPDGEILPTGAIGEVVLRGSNVITAYLADAEVNRAAFTADGWLRTGDLGHLDDQGYLTLTGRAKEIVNRGGEKISPREVEEALLAHTDVAAAAAFAVPHARLGEDLAVAIVLRADARASEGDLRRHVAQHLAPFKMPRRFVFVDAIPTGSTGKVSRTTLAQQLAPELGEGRTRRPFVEPRDPLELRVAALFAELLGLDEPVSIDDDFLALGADSLHLQELLADVERDFDRRLPATVLLSEPTVERLADLLRADHAASAHPPRVVPIQPHGTRPPLFCIVRAGTLPTLHGLAPALGPDQPILGLWLPEMHASRAVASDERALGEIVVTAIGDVQPHGPYTLLGHSSGGMVAYETARQLAAAGERVDLVVLLDTICRPRPKLTVTRRRLDRLFSRGGLHALARAASRRPPEDAAAAATAFVPGSADVVHDRASVEWREGMWARHVPPAVGPVLLLRTREGQEWTPEFASLGWDRVIDEQWEVHDVPGGHHTMLGEPYVRVVARRVADALTRGPRSATRSRTAADSVRPSSW